MPELPNVFSGLRLSGYLTSPATKAGSTVPSLSGAETQTGAGPYGTVPTVPDVSATMAEALKANISQMPQIREIMRQINEQSAQSAIAPLFANLPNLAGALGQGMANTTQLLGAQVPADVWRNLIQMAAERGVAIGSPLSPNANKYLLDALAKTSLQMQQTGLGNLTTLMSAVPRGTQFDPSGLLTTPAQEQQWQWLANMLKAAPDPTQAAEAELAAAQAGLGTGRSYGGYPSFSVPQVTAPSRTVPAAAQYAAAPSWATETGTIPAPTRSPMGGTIIDAQGDEWIPYDRGYMNLSTGEESPEMPPTGIPWTYEAPTGTTLTWTGQDWGDLFDDTGAGTESISDLEAYYGVPEEVLYASGYL